MWVVKLGGSLLTSPHLDDWLTVCAHYAGQLVIVPGGGPFADAVRDAQRLRPFSDAAAHHMALLAMQQYGLLLADLKPALLPVHNAPALRIALRSGQTPIWLPATMALAATDIEQSWRVTSDSLALWLARRLNAERLVLVKSVAPPPAATLTELMQAGLVDAAFGEYAAGFAGELCLLGPAAATELAAMLAAASGLTTI